MPIATTTALLVGGALAGAGASAYSANKAADAQKKAAAQASNIQQKQYQETRADLAPYREAGSTALSRYRDLLGFNGQEAAQTALRGYTESPFLPMLKQRTVDAVDSSRAARGGLFSGGTAQEIGDRTGELYLGDFNNYLSRIGGMADNGQNAAAQTGTFGANAAAGRANSAMAAGNATANGYINQANSFNNFLSQAAGAYGASQGGAFGGASGGGYGGTAYDILFPRG